MNDGGKLQRYKSLISYGRFKVRDWRRFERERERFGPAACTI